MSRRQLRHTRRDLQRQRHHAEQLRRQQADTGYWTRFLTLEVAR